eukprot:gb/GEZN01005561.1/.p1 GENE.gb/GEZN01005561.1/~~gb/GEZN01005561.1/.p1  ORF type:complete len:497 (-),score=57.41 gb/GEZN01005561.1/:123-1613(-)
MATRRRKNLRHKVQSASRAYARSLDDDHEPEIVYSPCSFSSPISHDLGAVKLCSMFLKLMKQFEDLREGRYAEERPGAPVFEMTRDAHGIVVTRKKDIVVDLQESTTKARQALVNEVTKRTDELLALDKEILRLEEGEGMEGECEQLALVIGQLHLLKRQHKKRIKELQRKCELKIKVQIDRACVRVEVVREETASSVTETWLVPIRIPCIYVMGGRPDFAQRDTLCTVERFDAESMSWKAVPPMVSRRFECMSTMANGFLYAVGGHDGMTRISSVERFNDLSWRWELVAPMPVPRSGGAVCGLKRKLYVVGGLSTTSDYLSSVMRYDPTTNIWTKMTPLTQGRAFCAAAVLDDVLYVMGGQNGVENLTTVEKFDPVRNEWEVMAESMTCRRSGCAAAVLNGEIYVVGGVGNASVERFNSRNGSWELVAPMNCVRALCAAVVLDGWLHAIGGQEIMGPEPGVTFSSAERYNHKNNTWTFIASMSCPRAKHSAAALW